ncbi:MAG: Crp/Fnr family transcriptional regulator [Gammaproteobacteria bacterium]|nr:Crp/Fnr family transcriptional regulator [Gammaproteobacteria bacterium]
MIHHVHLFRNLAAEETSLLTEHSTTRTYPANTVLITEGDQTDSLYVIIEGEVKVFVSDDQGKEAILNIMGEGEYFGELALLDDSPRSASVMTLIPTKVLIITKADFKRCLSSNPDLAYNIIKSLTQQVRCLTDNVKNLALMDVYGRVAHTLLDLAKDKDGKKVIEQRLTHQDIASMVGSSREMVSRILKDLSTGGYITVNKNKIIINEKLPAGW